VRRAIEWPVREIANNAGVDGAVVVGKLRERNDTNFGYDAQREVYLDMFKAGIINPTKVMGLALQDAASIAGLLITTEVLVAELPDKAPAMPGAMGSMAV
jgi:chaperonin GroEL